MEKEGKIWSLFFLLLVTSAFSVPYLLSDIPRMYGAFLYWVIFALIALVAMFLITAKWRD